MSQPTSRQLQYLRSLAERTGQTFTYPQTGAQASAEIQRLNLAGLVAAAVKAGNHHHLVYTYDPRSFHVGCIVTVAALVVAGSAYAYFTTTGSGSGTATVGSSSNLTVTGTTSGSLYPGTSSTVN